MIDVSYEIPKLYETDGVPLKEKMIYQLYTIPWIGFYWLIAEYDPEDRIAFGYANLNNDQLAEWGYIDVDELVENGAILDENWEPRKFQEAIEKATQDIE